MYQNTPGQSDCKIFKSTISLKQSDGKSLIYLMLTKIHDNWRGRGQKSV